MIQFTTITLLYSFASSLGDFEVRTPATCFCGGHPLTIPS
jgi:hypothetical protein